jgi:hypothetical protein
MSLSLLRRLLLYFFALFFIGFGLYALVAPALIAAKLNLAPVNTAGLGELRGLYGGGFCGIGVVILAGLRCKTAGPGLLLAIAIISCGIVAGRVLSMALDHDASFAAPVAIEELILAAACYFESRRGRVLA